MAELRQLQLLAARSLQQALRFANRTGLPELLPGVGSDVLPALLEAVGGLLPKEELLDSWERLEPPARELLGRAMGLPLQVLEVVVQHNMPSSLAGLLQQLMVRLYEGASEADLTELCKEFYRLQARRLADG